MKNGVVCSLTICRKNMIVRDQSTVENPPETFELLQQNENQNEAQNVPPLEEGRKARRLSREVKIFLYITAGVLCSLLLISIVAFVFIPLIFMCSIEFQRFAMFPALQEINSAYSKPQAYGLNGVRNLYVTVDKEENVVLGLWHLLPSVLTDPSIDYNNYDFDAALRNKTNNVVLYFHGNSGNRISPLPMYAFLRQFFHIIAFDYRGYGDSTPALLSEENVVKDSVVIYRWLMNKTEGNTFVWGHSLGAALASHTVAKLRDENIIPLGLFLEAPFNNMAEEVHYHPMGRIFSWLPWFRGTVVEPLKSNKFMFETDKTILMVDCPVLIVNAEDDDVVPDCLVKKLVREAQAHRNLTYQGPVRYHPFPKEYGCGHHRLYAAPELPDLIRDFVLECEHYRKYVVRTKRCC